MSTVTSEATQFQHTPEENVYLLCKTLCENGVADATGSDLFVVFISNEKKQLLPLSASSLEFGSAVAPALTALLAMGSWLSA